MNKFFRKLDSSTPRFNHPKHGIIDFRHLSNDRALEIWKDGFPYLGISIAGAKEYLSKMNSADLAALIKTRTDLDDVLILSKLKNTAAVKDAKEFMLKKIG